MANYVDVIVRLRSKKAIARLPATVGRDGIRGLTTSGGLVPARSARGLQHIGCDVFDATLGHRTGRQVRERRHNQRGTRLWLEQPSPQFDHAPWELLCDPTTTPPEHLATNILTPVIRRLVSRRGSPRPRMLPPIDDALQILVVAASPTDPQYAALDLRAEVRKLQSAVRTLVKRKAIVLTWIRGKNTAAQLTDHLTRGTCHVLHFIGHGHVDSGGTGFVVFEDGTGAPHLVPAAGLGALLAGHDVRLVLLNCCRGALAARGRSLPSMAAILAQHFPAVIGMQAAISDGAAITFASAFYQAIAHGRPIEIAVTQARLALSLMNGPGGMPKYIEWATPVLFLETSQDVFKLRLLVAAPPLVKRSARRSRIRTIVEAIPLTSGAKKPPPEDPQKFKWGEAPTRNGRTLSARVKTLDSGWYRITLTVTGTRTKPLGGSVVFHLHDTFDEPVRRVTASAGQATLTLVAWGAFTVGASCDGGRTKLELDLSELRGAPKHFRES